MSAPQNKINSWKFYLFHQLSTSLIQYTFREIKMKGEIAETQNHRIDKGLWKEALQEKKSNNKVTSFFFWASIEQLRMGMGGVCVRRQDNTQEWHSVIEISIKEVISGGNCWGLLVCVCVRVKEREKTECEIKAVNSLEIYHSSW